MQSIMKKVLFILPVCANVSAIRMKKEEFGRDMQHAAHKVEAEIALTVHEIEDIEDNAEEVAEAGEDLYEFGMSTIDRLLGSDTDGSDTDGSDTDSSTHTDGTDTDSSTHTDGTDTDGTDTHHTESDTTHTDGTDTDGTDTHHTESDTTHSSESDTTHSSESDTTHSSESDTTDSTETDTDSTSSCDCSSSIELFAEQEVEYVAGLSSGGLKFEHTHGHLMDDNETDATYLSVSEGSVAHELSLIEYLFAQNNQDEAMIALVAEQEEAAHSAFLEFEDVKTSGNHEQDNSSTTLEIGSTVIAEELNTSEAVYVAPYGPNVHVFEEIEIQGPDWLDGDVEVVTILDVHN